MPTLAAPLDCAKLEIKNERVHNLSTAPSTPVSGQLYFNTTDHTLYWYDDNLAAFVSARSGTGGPPSGAAGGDLTGSTYPNPVIAALAVTDAKVATANKDGAVGTYSMRTIGTGAQQSMAGNTRLDTIAAPTGSVSLNSQKIVSLADPTLSTDAATKNYVDTVIQGLDTHPSVKAATTANITLSGTQTVDGVALVALDRCLVKDQTTAFSNGIYVVAAGGWTRALDQDTWAEMPSAYVWVEQGTANADTGWTCTADQGGSLGVTSVTWTQFTGAAMITAGAGLTKTGNSLDIGAGAGITVNADTIQIANNGVTNAMIADGAINLNSADVSNVLPVANGGTGSSTATNARNNLGVPTYYTALNAGGGTTFSIPQTTHGMIASSRSIVVQVQVEATGAIILPDVTVGVSPSDVLITFSASQTSNTIRATLVGLQSSGQPT